ncbi:MAG: class I SAM-dependent RNA methyltransferase [Clostridia bacterium]|nr:class I SAM-dependent RNA methyltransferase [Clostridia bacterium]
MKIQMVATCMFGLERFLGEEIDALGLKRIETIDGRITFEGEPQDVARANVFLRTAERVLLKVGSFEARTFTELFDGTKALPWENYIGKNDAFPVTGHSVKSTLFSISDCQSIIKKAVVDRLSSKYGIKWFEETGVNYKIEFFIIKDLVTVMIDTSGVGLHKRGYRPAAGLAPLRETLAAAIVMNSRPRENVLLWDPFCGSGTIPIEAAMIMTNRAPGANREFLGETFDFLPKASWNAARAEAKDKVNDNTEFEAFGSDVDTEVLKFARENAARAGVSNRIKFFEADARKIVKPEGRRGTIVCNPPYGERLMTQKEVETLYREVGQHFSDFAPWQIYILSSCFDFEKIYGKRADKVRKLYNGMIQCNLYQYFKNGKK